MPKTILLVDDEPDLVAALRFALERDGFAVVSAGDGATALDRAFGPLPPDLVLLDLMLPDLPGTEVCRRLRADPRTAAVPVIMLTAKGEEIDRVVGFEVGADDYVVKPFSTRELLLRVRAVLRRLEGGASQAGRSHNFGCLRVDLEAHRVWVESAEITLTAIEFRLLGTFLQRRGRAQSRESLLDSVWGSDTSVTERTVDTHVKRLRQKLGAAGGYVETVRGIGYRFRDRPGEL